MNVEVIWKRLVIDGDRVVSSKRVSSLAESVGRDARRTIDYMLRRRMIERVLRGIFYVRSPAEREGLSMDHTIYEKIGMALNLKGVRNWYFAHETALKLNNMTHEHFNMGYVITDSYRTPGPIDILGMKFTFDRRSSSHFGDDIIIDDPIRYSNPVRTVLDLEYRDYLNGGCLRTSKRFLNEYSIDVASEIVEHYRPGFKSSLRSYDGRG